MALEILDTISLPGDPARINEDAFGHIETAAAVLDGATPLGDPLMPGDSDAAWIAHFGARRLMAHLRDGDDPHAALTRALQDAEHSFTALRRAPPAENWQLPLASMMLLAEAEGAMQALWFGDCTALIQPPGEAVQVIGDALAGKAREQNRARRLAKETGLAPAAGINRPKILDALRASRNLINTAGHWTFSPDARAAAHVRAQHLTLPRGTAILIATDGFLMPVSDYDRHTPATFMARALSKGLGLLADELREIEDADADGHKHPRFKKSDDATAVLLRTA